MAPANSKALDRMGEVYYEKLRAWQAAGAELKGLKEEILARMRQEKIKLYKTADGTQLKRGGKETLSASKLEPKEP